MTPPPRQWQEPPRTCGALDVRAAASISWPCSNALESEPVRADNHCERYANHCAQAVGTACARKNRSARPQVGRSRLKSSDAKPAHSRRATVELGERASARDDPSSDDSGGSRKSVSVTAGKRLKSAGNPQNTI